MLRLTGLVLALTVPLAAARAAPASVTMNAITAEGVGAEIGTVTLEDTADGLRLTPNLRSLPAGERGFHVHVNPACGPADNNGKPAAGFAAGGHYDPAGSGKHEGPHGNGHAGDLPALTVAADGTATNPVVAHRLTVKDVAGRALMIHADGDNYADQPQPLGGGGGRIACGVITG
ncbi:superoxide dismutase family protein [Oleisolibacter albus]|uniref:superoxide dismutase family protein n=1 Tax=Oleisolibacter albus TaxID=2171757 RepID=UPI000DF2ABAC|nr:superoxide dismutase family protein [Oleisolibacter albus]